MAQIKDRGLVANLLAEGVRAVADGDRTIVEVSDPQLASLLQIEPRTLRGWKTPSGIPNNIEDEKFLGLVWLILSRSTKDLAWLTRLLKATSIIVVEPPGPDWVRSCLLNARLENTSAGQVCPPSKEEVERVVRRLFLPGTITLPPASGLVNASRAGAQSGPSAGILFPHKELPGEVVPLGSQFYIERLSDKLATQAISSQGTTLIIKAPRQMGKSSLLLRLSQLAEAQGKRVVTMDFQLFDRPTLAVPQTFYRYFCNWISRLLEVENQVEQFWNEPMPDVQRCTAYLAEYLLPKVGTPLVLAMDEVDHIFDTELRSDFFAMLRHWHNSRQIKPVWQRLDLILVTSTQPYQLIDNLNHSPFNVGETIELEDFKPEQVIDLARRHKISLERADERRLVNLLGGQPYLVQQAFYLLASGRYSPGALFEQVLDDRGPFGEHLRSLLQKLFYNPRLVEGMRQIIQEGICPDETVFWRLQGAGLVKREGRTVRPRYLLYGEYFQNRLG